MDKRWVETEQPLAIANYVKHMGGVDRLDWFINKYRTGNRSKNGISVL